VLIQQDLKPLDKLRLLLGKDTSNDEELDNEIDMKLIPIVINNLAKEGKVQKLKALLEDLSSFVNESNRQYRVCKYKKETPVHIAVKNNNIELCKLLIDSGFEINCLDEQGKSPLFYACRTGNRSLVQLLMYYGAEGLVNEVSGSYMCELAKKDELKSINAYYIAYESQILSKDFDKRTIAHIAAIRNNEHLMKFLLDNIAYPFYRDKDLVGKSAYDYANDKLKELISNSQSNN
jgi:uncharacterized protein